MKRLITILIAMVISVASFAQVSVGAGYASSKLADTESINFDGFYVEGTYEVPILSVLSFMPGVRFNYAMTNDILGDCVKWADTYIELPVALVGVVGVGPLALKPYVQVVPSVGVTGKVSASGAGITVEENIYEDGEYKRFDVLGGAGLMIDVKSILRLKVGYDYGFLSRINKSDTHRSMITAGVAFVF